MQVSFFFLDVNECIDGSNNCEQVCENTEGSFSCSCNSGFTLASDGRSCTADPVEPDGICGGTLTSSSGSFQTPGWPNSYPQENFQCVWIIDVPDDGSVIEFTVDDSAFGINGAPPCTDDFIEFFDGADINAISIHKACRYDLPPVLTTTSSQARVVFAGSIRPHRPAGRVGVRVAYRTIQPVVPPSSGEYNIEY